MINKAYWRDKTSQLWAGLEVDEATLLGKMDNEYSRQLAEFDKDIASYYSKYGKGNVIEYSTLMQGLSPAEKTMAIEKWADFTAKNPELTHLTPVRESIYKYNRLQGLQDSVLRQQLKIGVKDASMVKNHLISTGTAGIRAGYTAQGMSDMMNAMNPKQMEQLISKQWAKGYNYSDSIWKNKQKLADYLGNDFATGVSRGESYDSMIKKLNQRFTDVSKADARRLVYTEGTFTMNESMIQAFEGRFEEYKFSAHIDSKTSDVCQGLNGQVFKVTDRMAGTNFPPMHPRCRSSFEIVIPDEAQPPTPPTPPVVPPKVTGGPKNPMNTQGGINTPPVVQQPLPTFSMDVNSGMGTALAKSQRDELTDMINATQDAQVINFWNKYMNKVQIENSSWKGTEHYSHRTNGINFRKTDTHLDSSTGPKYETLLHESAHWIDFNTLGYHSSVAQSLIHGVDKAFDKALRSDVDKYIKAERAELRAKLDADGYTDAVLKEDFEWFWKKQWYVGVEDIRKLPTYAEKLTAAQLQKHLKEVITKKHKLETPYDIYSVCDVIDGATSSKYYTLCGHGPTYWKRSPDNLAIEAFAEMVAARTVNKRAYEMFKKITPEAVKVFEKMLDEINSFNF